jgi:hypothetical protein
MVKVVRRSPVFDDRQKARLGALGEDRQPLPPPVEVLELDAPQRVLA